MQIVCSAVLGQVFTFLSTGKMRTSSYKYLDIKFSGIKKDRYWERDVLRLEQWHITEGRRTNKMFSILNN